ncbi:MAG: 16S rRNA (cytosine(1402)-N(4))-methyltransferase RsmH [Pseudomonadota bacterium]
MNKIEYPHQSVMLKEALYYLAVQGGGIYIDGTYGRGGHTQSILDHLDKNGRLVAIDKDVEACEHAQSHYANDARFSIQHTSFNHLSDVATAQGISGSVNGILLDLGISSPHVDNPERGFSFMREGPLDMRMDQSTGKTAAQWLAEVSEDDLERILRVYGEERYAQRIAKGIIDARQTGAIDSTKRLASIIASLTPSHERHKHPATRCFQAIRIFINNELEELQTTLEQALDVLTVGGRLVVISFHSLEDRIVKKFINKHARGDSLPRGLPLIEERICRRLEKINGTVRASEQEISTNPRARSAVLRAVEKIS